MVIRSAVRKGMLAGLLLAAIARVAIPAPLLLVGDGERLVLIRSSATENAHDITIKPLHGDWKWIHKQVDGKVIAAAITDNQLHVLVHDPFGYLIYNLPREAVLGSNPDDPQRWSVDTAPIALCEATGLHTKEGPRPTVLAVVPRVIGASSPENRHTREVLIGVFANTEGSFAHVSECPIPLGLGSEGRLFAQTVGGSLFVLICERTNKGARLVEFADGKWVEIPLKGWARETQVVGMLVVRDKLIVITSVPKPGGAGEEPPVHQLHLGLYEPDAQVFSFGPLTIEGSQFEWIGKQLPLPAPLGERIALLFPDEDAFAFTTCEQTGRGLPLVATEPFDTSPDAKTGIQVLETFHWVVMVVILAAMFLLRPRTPPKAFVLPATMHPANPIKRLLAAMIDFLPWSLIGVAVFQVEPASLETLREMSPDEVLSVNRAGAYVFMLLAYTAYSIVMERRFKATVGKMIFKLRVVADNGLTPGLREIVLRNLVRLVELSFPLGLPILLLIPLFNRNRQRLGDWMARTAVIDLSASRPAAPEEAKEQEDLAPSDSDEPHKGE